MKITPTKPIIPFTNYFQMNIPFGGLFQNNTCPQTKPSFKGQPQVFRGHEVTGDDGGCIKHKVTITTCQPIKPETTEEIGNKLHAYV